MNGENESNNAKFISDTKEKGSSTELDAMKARLLAMEAQVKMYKSQLAEKEKKNTPTVEKEMKLTSQKVSNSSQNARTKHLSQTGSADFLFGKKSQSGQGASQLGIIGLTGETQNSKKRKSSSDATEPASKRASFGQAVITEKYTGLRLMNPLVSSSLMEERMKGRKFILIHQLSSKIVNGEIAGDWVTGGVVVSKLPPRASASGKPFSILHLSSLVGGFECKTVALLLFGACNTDHWKIQVGMCIALLNPTIMPPKEDKTAQGSAITIEHPQQVMELGTAKDYGICKGVSKKKGSHCKNAVNKSYGEYCEYHIVAEYRKSMANRMEFQYGYGAPRHDARRGQMMNQLRKNIDGGQYYYGGEVVTLGAPKEKNKVTLKSIMGHTLQAQARKQIRETKVLAANQNQVPTKGNGEEHSSEEFKQLLQLPTAGTRNLMKHLKKEDQKDQKAKANVKFVSITPTELLKREKANMAKLQEKRSVAKVEKKHELNSLKNRTVFAAPLLARGCAPDEDIEFADCGDIVSNNLGKRSDPNAFYQKQNQRAALAQDRARPDYNKEKAKRRAVQLWRDRNIDAENNDSVGKKRSPEQVKEILRKVDENHGNDGKAKKNDEKSSRKPSLLSAVFGPLDLQSEEGKKIVAAKSANSDLVKEDEINQSGVYFKALEKREMYEEKLQKITELKVTAYCCKQCKYIAESASKYCEDEKHMVIKVQARKRFFSCKKCKNRTYALNDKIPNHACRNCGEMNYERVSMYKEKEGPKQEREKLLIRGEERKFLNSLK